MTKRTFTAGLGTGTQCLHDERKGTDVRWTMSATVRFLLMAVLFLLLNGNGAWGEEAGQKPDDTVLIAAASARVDRDTITIGDTIKYTIEVKAGKDVEIQPPDIEVDLAGFAARDLGSSKSGLFGKRTTTFWYLLDTYETGRHTIPGMTIRYRARGTEEWREMTLNDVGIEVKSVLGDQAENADIKDIRGPVGFQAGLYLYILAGVAVALVIAAVIVLILRRRKNLKSIVVPPRPAHEIAYEALVELRKQGYLEKGMIKEYYTELSDIVRRYLENRFGLRAPEMTTEEFLQKVKDAAELNAGQKDLLRDFLSHCDLVKFAGFNPEKHEIDESHESAGRFIDQTRYVTPPGSMVVNNKEVVKT